MKTIWTLRSLGCVLWVVNGACGLPALGFLLAKFRQKRIKILKIENEVILEGLIPGSEKKN
jgi:hypothetical protein